MAAALILAGCGGGGAAVRGGGAVVSPEELSLGSALPVGQLARIGWLCLSHPAAESAVSQVAVADGGAVVSSNGRQMRVWEPTTGALRWQASQLDHYLDFSLSGDGKLIAVAYHRFSESGGHVEIFESGGRRRGRIETGEVRVLAFSPDGTKLVVGGDETEVFSVADGRAVATLKQQARMASFAGEREVIVVDEKTARRWHWEDGKVEEVMQLSSPFDAWVLAPDGSAMAWAIGAAVHVVRLDGAGAVGAAGAARTASELVAPAPVNGLALGRGGAAVAVGWQDGIALWSLGGKPRQKWQLPAHAKTPSTRLAFSADGQTLVASALGQLSTIDAARGVYLREPGEPLRFHDFAADGGVLLARGDVLERLDLRSGARTPARAEPSDAPPWANGRIDGAGGVTVGWNVEAAFECKPLEVWRRGAASRVLPLPAGCYGPLRGVWHLGPGLAFADGNPQEVWDVASQQVLLRRPMQARPLVTAAFSANRRWLVVVHGPHDPVILIDAARMDAEKDGTEAEVEADAGAGEDAGAEEVDDHVYHLDEDEYDPIPERFLLEIFDLSLAKSESEVLVREHLWDGAGQLEAAAILDDGTIFVGRNDGAVLAARITDDELSKVAQLGAGVSELRAAPGGAVVAVTDGDDQTLLLTAGVMKAVCCGSSR